MSVFGSVSGGTSSTEQPESGIPFLYRSAADITSYVGQASLNHQLAVGYSSKLVSCGLESSALKSRTYSSGAWGSAVSVGSAGNTKPIMMFLDSNGNIYVSGENSRELCRSTDDGATWTVLIDSATLAAGTEIRSMTEDNDGNLYASEYGLEIGLFKSTDSGATWTKIVDGTTGYTGSGYQNASKSNLPIPDDHIHNVMFDPYRNVIISCFGDLAGSYPQVSDDGGATWTNWGVVDQPIAMAFDENYIYMASDRSGERGIWRTTAITGTGVAAFTGVTASEVFDVTTLADISADNDIGHCWWGWEDDGIVFFCYGASGSGTATGAKAHLIASWDQGDNWSNVSESQTYAQNSNTIVNWAHDPAMPSWQAKSLWDGFFYHKVDGLSNDYMARWKMYPRPTTITIDPTNGVDYLSQTQKNLLEIGLPPGIEQKLVGNVSTDHIQNGLPGALINKNGYTFTDTGAVSAHETQNLDGAYSDSWGDIGSSTGPSWDATNYYGASGQSRRFAYTAGSQWGGAQRVNVFTRTPGAGEDNCWMQAQYRIETYTPAGEITLHKITKNSDYITIRRSAAGLLSVRFNLTAGDYQIYTDTGVTIPFDTWFKLKLHWYRHATQGRIRAWVDGQLIVDVSGIDTTYNTATGDFTAQVGCTLTDAAFNLNVDDIKCSYADPDEPADITLTATGQKVIPDGVYS